MLDEKENHSAIEGTLIYNSEYNYLELNGYELRSDDNIEINILGSWIPGRIAVDNGGWYLVTQDHVGIRLHTGLSARVSEQDTQAAFAMQPSTTPPPLILLVDDDISLLQALPRTISLRMPEAQVITCQTAQEALQKLQEHRYDAVVSDIKMPDMDGLELLAQIRDIQPMTPTLLITGHGDHELAIRALRGGAYDYILKPIERDSFIAALLRAIQSHQLRRKVEEQQQTLEQHARTLERIVQQRTQELIEANGIKDKVIGLVTHELHTPLYHLKEITQLLQRKLQNVEAAEIVSRGFEDIDQSISRIETLIQELLDTSRLEARMFILQRQHCDMIEICQDVLQAHTIATSAQLSSEVLKKPLPMEVDTAQLRQVLTTLLPYAYAYSASNVLTRITLQRVGHEAIISIRDLDLQTGLKLELYVARNIVERHNGRLEIQNFPENRSTVFIMLPLSDNISNDNEDETEFLPRTYATWAIQK